MTGPALSYSARITARLLAEKCRWHLQAASVALADLSAITDALTEAEPEP